MISDTCIIVITIIFVIIMLYDLDENYMDSYDRYWNIAGDGRKRGLLGIYNEDDSINWWYTLFDTNPCRF